MLPISDSHPTGKLPFWVLVIIILNIYIFYLELTSSFPDEFISQFALIPGLVNFDDFSTLKPLITSQFLHGGFLHIISNMWFLWIFGDNVEEKSGFILFPFFYLASGVAGAFLQYVFMSGSQIPMLGASGAIAGVLGAYFAWFPNNSIKTLIPVFGFFTIADIPAFFMLVYWLITQVFSGALSITTMGSDLGGVAYLAHIGGFLFGFLTAKIFK